MNKSICGINVHAFISTDQFLNSLIGYKGLVIAVNAEKIINSSQEFKALINSNLGYPDGYGTVLALRRLGFESIKIPGAEVWIDIIARNLDKSFYFIGSTQEVLDQTKEKISTIFPNIIISGSHNGYISDEQKKKLINNIVESKPDFVFVAQGSPMQELLMTELFEHHSAIYMGLGGSFDLFVGTAKPVPSWWKTYFKWEGLYRCMNDITNIDRWRRQPAVFKLLYRILTGKI